MGKRRVTVRYQVATYSGEIKVDIDENNTNDVGERKAESQLRRKCGGSFPFGYQSFHVIHSEYLDDEDDDY
jgi:hypothetical protein